MRIVKIKNLQATADAYCGQEIQPGEYYQLQSDVEQIKFASDVKVQSHLSLANILINDGTKDITDYLTAKRWLEGSEPTTLDGRGIYQNTPRMLGTFAYYTGAGDCSEHPLEVGGDEDDLLSLHHQVGDPATQTTYCEFTTVNNETYLLSGSIQWKDALNDTVSFEIVPHVTPYTSGSGTYFNLYGGYLIVPAAGTGLISVSPADIKLVQCTPNEFGVVPAGYWNATFNTTTGLFENITPAPYGDGKYNIFGAEVVFQRFVNRFQLLGQQGLYQLPSSDISQIPHGTRIKATSRTKGDDHDWWWCANITLYRKRTC